ncbi:hypothetical protein vseg_001708 [Gypsophila vaccaria]
MASVSPKLVPVVLFVICASNLAILEAIRGGLENKDVCKVDNDCVHYSVICGSPSKCYDGKCNCIYSVEAARDGPQNGVCKADNDCVHYSVLCGSHSTCYAGQCVCVYSVEAAKAGPQKEVCKVDNDCVHYSVLCGSPSKCYDGKCDCIYNNHQV